MVTWDVKLVGAGMVVRRAAPAECGWVERPLLADRIDKRLVSGGDVEIAQRIRGAGYPLWFTLSRYCVIAFLEACSALPAQELSWTPKMRQLAKVEPCP